MLWRTDDSAARPPDLAQPGQPYLLLSFAAYSFEGGDPSRPHLSHVATSPTAATSSSSPTIAGPFVYQNADPTQAGPNVLWRTDVGQYTFQWQVPPNIPAGVYTANWTWTYGDDTFLAAENFTVPEGGPFGVVPPVDVGFWTGSLSYQPAWASAPFVIPFGGVDAQRGRVDSAVGHRLGRAADGRADRAALRRPWRLAVSAVLRATADHPGCADQRPGSGVQGCGETAADPGVPRLRPGHVHVQRAGPEAGVCAAERVREHPVQVARRWRTWKPPSRWSPRTRGNTRRCR